MLGSLRFRAAVAYVLLIAVAFAALGLYLLARVEHDFRAEIKADLASQARMTANLVLPLIDEGAPPSDFDRLAKQLGAGTDTRITIIAPSGTVLGDSEADPATMDNHLSRPEVQGAIRSGQGESERHSDTLGIDLTYVATAVTVDDSVAAVVRAARPTEAVNTSASDITRSTLIAIVITAASAALLSLAVGTTIMRPLGRLARAARSVAAGNLGERVKPRPSGEVGDVADAFNQMAQSVEELVAAASEERSRLTAVLNSSTDAILAVDAEGRIAFANQAAELLLGRGQDDMVGHPLAWAMPDDQVVRALRASREAQQRETRIIERPDGHTLRVSTAPIVGGGEWVALAVFHDTTEARRLEETRRDFVANVSHELRTPLASIKSVIETLQAGALEDRPATEDFLARADAEVDRMAQIVEELLELSRLESGQVPLAREPVEMGSALGRAVERLRPQAEKKGLRLTLEVAADLPPVTGDADRLERVALNLIHNAIKFTPDGGSVDVSAALVEAAVAVEVADSGVGIAPEELPRIFERFYKADRARGSGGTGLGLAVVKHIVEAHGGTVSVRSEQGHGSVFTFTIPVVSSSPDS
jgi:two-component system phosphate regulon sensor histidine kinase PhoR